MTIKLNHSSISWVDLLRIFACFLVVLAHACDPFVANSAKSVFDFQCGVCWGSLVRPCVPLFAMISGVLLLPATTGLGTFCSKRLKKILVPFIIWSLVLPLLYFCYFSAGFQTTNPNIAATSYTWSATINKLYTVLFNFNYDTTPLWYLYMLIGLYLIFPIIGAWLNQASKKDIHIFLFVWILSLALPGLQLISPALGYGGVFGNPGLLGVCDWNPFGSFYYFSGFIGYSVLAYYCVKYPFNWSWTKTLAITLPLFLVGYGISLWGFFTAQKFFPAQYPKLEIPWFFCSPNVLMMTISIFLIAQKISIRSSILLRKIASLTLGVFLCHFFILQCVYDALIHADIILPTYLHIPLIACIVFLISLFFVWLLSLNRWTRKCIM